MQQLVTVHPGIGIEASDEGRGKRIAIPERVQEVGEGCARRYRLRIVIITNTSGKRQAVGYVEIDFTKDPEALQFEVGRIVPIHRCGEVGRRGTCREGGKRPEYPGRIIETEGVYVITVLADIGLRINPANKEVERPVEIARQDRFAGPRGLVLD